MGERKERSNESAQMRARLVELEKSNLAERPLALRVENSGLFLMAEKDCVRRKVRLRVGETCTLSGLSAKVEQSQCSKQQQSQTATVSNRRKLSNRKDEHPPLGSFAGSN